MSKIVVVDDSYAELQLIEGCLKNGPGAFQISHKLTIP